MNRDEISIIIRRKRVEDDLRQIFEQSLQAKIDRHLEIQPHPIIAYHHFSAVSAECIDLYRDGHYYGCIALIQAVTEALSKFLCERNGWRPDNVFEENVRKLRQRNFISDELQNWLLDIWDKRNDYHHLNPTVEQERIPLQELARHKLSLLANVEKDIFNFALDGGRIVPTHLKYWDIQSGDKMPAYLRFD